LERPIVIEGPYKSRRWHDRLLSLATGLELLQALSVAVGAIIVGVYWLVQGEYLKFGVVYGVGAGLLFGAIRTRTSWLFMLFIIWCFGAALVAGPI
jgi:hypothetical protein